MRCPAGSPRRRAGARSSAPASTSSTTLIAEAESDSRRTAFAGAAEADRATPAPLCPAGSQRRRLLLPGAGEAPRPAPARCTESSPRGSTGARWRTRSRTWRPTRSSRSAVSSPRARITSPASAPAERSPSSRRGSSLQAGEEVARVVLFGAPFPERVPQRPGGDAAAVACATRRDATRPASRQGSDVRSRGVRPRTPEGRSAATREHRDPALENRRRIEDATIDAVKRYEPGFYPGRVDAFLPSEAWRHAGEGSEEWKQVARQVVEHVGPDGADGDNMLQGAARPSSRRPAQSGLWKTTRETGMQLTDQIDRRAGLTRGAVRAGISESASAGDPHRRDFALACPRQVDAAVLQGAIRSASRSRSTVRRWRCAT